MRGTKWVMRGTKWEGDNNFNNYGVNRKETKIND